MRGRPVNVIKIDVLNRRIRELEEVRNRVEYELAKENKNIQEEIFRKYIELQKISEVVEYLNDKGYRIIDDDKCNERRYIANDVSTLLKTNLKDLDIEKNLYRFTKALFDFNKGKISWNRILKECEPM
ncbi:MAG: hypothetical protein FH761_17815 [Firmicutes bacterium]|nr:hypothetical protein [Bacillota bacterium]